MNKKHFKLFGILAILLSLSSLTGCKLFQPKAKEFNVSNELKITLTEDFVKSGTLDSTSSWSTGVSLEEKNNTALVQVFRWKQSEFNGFESPNLTEFSKIASSKNINYDIENELCYTNEYETSRIYVKSYFFKTDFAYYEIDFRYVSSGDSRIHDWAKSINFTQDLIYDIDQTMTNTKTITLDQQDGATINIGTSFIKVLDEAKYQKLRLDGTIYRNQLSINISDKNDYDSLQEYALDLGYTNRNLTDKDYIALSGSGYFVGIGTANIYVYCFESENHYYTLEFTSNELGISQTFDSYADSFQSN